MKIKLYTKSHPIELLKKYSNNNEIFTAKEHSKIVEEGSGEIFKSKSKLLESYLSNDIEKISSIKILIDRIKKKNYKVVASLGSGPSVLEYFLYLSIPKNKQIISSDFDTFTVRKSNEFFPEFKTIEFDFFRDTIKKFDTQIDMVFFFGSSYVMDDNQFIKLLKDIKSHGIKEIVDFHVGCMKYKDPIIHVLKTLKNFVIPNKDKFKGKFHGYLRNKGHIKKLIKEAGWFVSSEIKNDKYYITILN